MTDETYNKAKTLKYKIHVFEEKTDRLDSEYLEVGLVFPDMGSLFISSEITDSEFQAKAEEFKALFIEKIKSKLSAARAELEAL